MRRNPSRTSWWQSLLVGWLVQRIRRRRWGAPSPADLARADWRWNLFGRGVRFPEWLRDRWRTRWLRPARRDDPAGT